MGKIRNWFFYRKCKVWKEDYGFPCYVCTASTCFRNHFLETLKYMNGKCIYKDCENKQLENKAHCEKHDKSKI